MLNYQTHKCPCCVSECIMSNCNEHLNPISIIKMTREKFSRNNIVYCLFLIPLTDFMFHSLLTCSVPCTEILCLFREKYAEGLPSQTLESGFPLFAGCMFLVLECLTPFFLVGFRVLYVGGS